MAEAGFASSRIVTSSSLVPWNPKDILIEDGRLGVIAEIGADRFLLGRRHFGCRIRSIRRILIIAGKIASETVESIGLAILAGEIS